MSILIVKDNSVVTINPRERQVSVNGRNIHLTGKEYSVLEFMASRQGWVISKDAFLNHLYGDTDKKPGIKIIDVFICKLRKKLEQAGVEGIIGTSWGHGYMMCGHQSSLSSTYPLTKRSGMYETNVSDNFSELKVETTDPRQARQPTRDRSAEIPAARAPTKECD